MYVVRKTVFSGDYMHKLKSDIIHALQSVPMSTDKLVEVSNICDAYANESLQYLAMAKGAVRGKGYITAIGYIDAAIANLRT